jgi:uncharacterized protein YbaR (Trm112 family)
MKPPNRGPAEACNNVGPAFTDQGMDKRLLDILVCPVTQAPLEWHPDRQELWCRASRLAYPVRDGIPVMLEDEARELAEAELGR